MSKSTRKRSANKPAKPSDFPLWKHPSGRWCKKFGSRFCYFGKVADDPTGQAALDRYLAERDYLQDGRTPPVDKAGLTVEYADWPSHDVTSELP